MEGLGEPLLDLLIEYLYLSIIVINRASQQLTPHSQYTAQFTMLSLILVVTPLALILIFAYIRPLINWLDALFYIIGLIIGTTIFIYANINNAGLFSNIIGNVISNMLLILGFIMLGFATRIYISLLKQERDYW
ncbi:hypothetical protein DDW12_09610 [Sulfolobus islandicus]|nr:hypothetical protein DDW12_09610 [Sulfolobus islandicus]